MWLTLENGSIVDITGDQYSNRTGMLRYDMPVYVGQIDAFHKQFRLNGEPLEITPDDWTPDFLGETNIQRKKPIAYGKYEVCRLKVEEYKKSGETSGMIQRKFIGSEIHV